MQWLVRKINKFKSLLTPHKENELQGEINKIKEKSDQTKESIDKKFDNNEEKVKKAIQE